MGGRAKVPTQLAHVFDERAFHILCRGEQLLGRLQGGMEDLQFVATHALTAYSDEVLDVNARAEVLQAQRLIMSVMQRVRRRVLPDQS